MKSNKETVCKTRKTQPSRGKSDEAHEPPRPRNNVFSWLRHIFQRRKKSSKTQKGQSQKQIQSEMEAPKEKAGEPPERRKATLSWFRGLFKKRNKVSVHQARPTNRKIVELIGSDRSDEDLQGTDDESDLLESMYDRIFKLVAKRCNVTFDCELDRGSNGAVFKTVDEESGKEMAVKIEPFHEKDAIANWLAMNNERILPLHEVYLINESLTAMEHPTLECTAYLMPYLPTTLEKEYKAAKIRSDPSAYEKSLKWIQQCLQGVAYMHENGYYHLDIKTDNVLIDEKGQAVLADFGSLTRDAVAKSLTSPAVYQSPEARSPDSHLYSEKQDLWALGITILNVLTCDTIISYLLSEDLTKDDVPQIIGPLVRALKEKEFFRTALEKSYPGHTFTRQQKDLCWRFVRKCLKENPSRRLSAKRLLKHRLLSDLDQ